MSTKFPTNKSKILRTKIVMYDGIPVEVAVYESAPEDDRSRKVCCKVKFVFDKNAKHNRQK